VFVWGGSFIGVLYGFSSDRDHFWGNFVTFFNPRALDTEEDEIDFLEAGEAQLNPERADRYYRDGRKALDQFKFAQAQVSFKRAIQSNPTDPKLHYNLARAYFATGQTVDGEASLRKTLEFDPKHVEALLLLAELMNSRERADEANKYASLALQEEPDNLNAVRLNASLLAARSDREAVRPLLDQLLAKDSENPNTLSFAGRLEFGLYDRPEQARRLIEQALELNPDHIDSLLAMIPIYAKDEDLDSVNDMMDRVLTLQPENLQALRLRAEMQMSRYGLGVGLRYYRDLMTQFGNNLQMRLRYAELLLKAGNIAEGKRLAVELTASRVPNIERTAHWMLAQMYGQLRMFDEAISHAQSTLRLVPDATNVQVFLAQQYLQSGEPTLARRALERALIADPNNTGMLALMSQILVQLGQANDALALLDGKLQESPEDDRLRMRKVEIQMQTESWQQAMSDTEMLLKKFPDNPGLKNNMAFLLARSGQDLPRALELVTAAREQVTDNPVIKDTYGYVLAAMGQYEEALAMFEEAIGQNGGNMVIRFHYAQSLAAVGRAQDALNQLEAVLIISPDFPQAEEARALRDQLMAEVGGA
jgi:tetratricopeptide (TPR) repeat protein